MTTLSTSNLHSLNTRSPHRLLVVRTSLATRGQILDAHDELVHGGLGTPVGIPDAFTDDHRNRSVSNHGWDLAAVHVELEEHAPQELLNSLVPVKSETIGESQLDENFRVIEPYSDTPDSRLKSIRVLNNSGVATNVMIKPFIQGITDLEASQIAQALILNGIRHCVVGDLLLDETIKGKLIPIAVLPAFTKEKSDKQVLDCTSGESYELNTSAEMNAFCNALSYLGIRVFKKSSCVNSFILGKPNPANYIESDPHGYCIKCGVCE